MAGVLKPESEVLVGATSIALVLAIFGNTAPNVSDVRADRKGNANTHKATKLAALTATAAVGSLALIGKSQTVAVIGFGTILFEVWKLHFANYGANGTEENQEAGMYSA